LASKSKELSCRLNIDRSAISRTTQRLSRDPELPAATKTIQKELDLVKINIETMFYHALRPKRRLWQPGAFPLKKGEVG
jgi:hypothetical protein